MVFAGPLQAQAAPQATTQATAAATLFNKRDWKGAAAAFEAMVAEAPRHAEAWFGLGQCRHNLGEYDAAVEAFARALDSGYKPEPIHYHTARALAAKGDRAGAVAALERLGATGARYYQALSTEKDFDSLRADPAFRAIWEPMKPCSAPHYRDFDFWLGEWRVINSRTGAEATSSVTSGLGGCVVREEYAQGDFAGSSLSFHDAVADRWHQTWVDSNGASLRLSGLLSAEGEMVLRTEQGVNPAHRIAWTPLADGRVRQLWQTSRDGGEEWTVVFDGVYLPRNPP